MRFECSTVITLIQQAIPPKIHRPHNNITGPRELTMLQLAYVHPLEPSSLALVQSSKLSDWLTRTLDVD